MKVAEVLYKIGKLNKDSDVHIYCSSRYVSFATQPTKGTILEVIFPCTNYAAKTEIELQQERR